MKRLSSVQLRKLWITFFESKDHYVIPSSSLIPVDDDSLLWINSGVATLKKYFEGKSKPPSKRMVNYQKSLRTNDISNVGRTSRHHTFFEMLGNFSIGDYFVKEAIAFAWEFLTSKDWLDIDPSKLFITVFNEDEETYQHWVDIGVPKDHLFKLSRSTNFWDVGKGPCGPNTEIFFDRGEKYDSRGSELIINDIENDRFIEIWNIVISKFNNDGKGNYLPLPQKNIDTGAGFERLVTISQDKPSSFETDLFMPIIEKLQKYTSFKYESNYYSVNDLDKDQAEVNYYFKSIVDFVRAVSFAISDGAKPANIGRGYVLRKLLRRSILNLNSLKVSENVLSILSSVVIDIYKETYPQLEKSRDIIVNIFSSEEQLFKKSLKNGLNILEKKYLNNLEEENVLRTSFVFKLFETFGLPKEMIDIEVKRKNLTYNELEFNDLMHAFKEQSRLSTERMGALEEQNTIFSNLPSSEFIGYDVLNVQSKLIGKEVKDDFIFLAFEKSPFYSESGGQISDQGDIEGIKVQNVFKNSNNTIIHVLNYNKNYSFEINEYYSLSVDSKFRKKIEIHHSAVHLLFAALEHVTGLDLPQRGSYISESYFRFDFSCHRKITEAEMSSAIKMVKKWIREDVKTNIYTISQAAAKESGAKFLDNIKYGEEVRVVDFKGITTDLCGGTHVKSTSIIEDIRITNFESRGSGIYRINGICTNELIEEFNEEQFQKILNNFKTFLEESKQRLQDLNEDFAKISVPVSNHNAIDFDQQYDRAVKLKYAHSSDINMFDNHLYDIQNKISSSLEEWENQNLIFLINVIITDSNSKSFQFKNLSKKFFSSLSKRVLEFEKTSNIYLTNEVGDEVTITIIINDGFTFNNKLHSEFLRSNNILGGGSRNFYQYKMNQDKLKEFLKLWPF